MRAKEKRDSSQSPVNLKLGFALIFSIGGIVYTFFRSKRGIGHFKPKCSPGNGNNGETVDDDNALQRDGERNGFTLSELDQLLKEYNVPAIADDNSIRKNEQSLGSEVESPMECKCAEHEREIRSLQNKVSVLEEREKMLEIQLLEYYGLEEQGTALAELQSQLRLNNMETKLYKVKIESLQSDMRQLEAQVVGYDKTVGELVAAKAKIKQLQSKLNLEAEQNRKQIFNLQERVLKLQDQEKRAVEIDQDVDIQLKKTTELEKAVEELKNYNHSLKLENSEMAQKLERMQMLASSGLDNEEATALKEETERLRQENQDLRKEIEQLQVDRCKEIEELVYLRWVNACLRYELRNYQPGPGKTIARDLSRTLSPKSEKKAKQLILEYANKEGFGDEEINIADFDSGRWSTSLASYLAEEQDDIPIDNLSSNKKSHSTKMRVFAKLIKLFRGKDSEHYHVQTPASPLDFAASVGDSVSGDFSISHSGTSSSVDARVDVGDSPDVQQSQAQGQKCTFTESSKRSRGTSDDAFLTIFRRFGSISRYDSNPASSTPPREDAENATKELAKYAEALTKSHAKSSSHRRSVSSL